MTKEEIEAVLAGCDGVTPGPWEVHERNVRTVEPGRHVARLDWHTRDESDDANAAHIARLSPEFVRDLAALALEALSSREAGWQGKIKPLEWVQEVDGEMPRWGAETPCGRYEVGLTIDEDWYWWPPGVIGGNRSKDEISAKAAAQADYEARIRSAPLPNPPDQGSKSP